MVRRVCEKRIGFEFTLALTNVRSLVEDYKMDRMRAIRMGRPMKVHKCDGNGKVGRSFVKSMIRRDKETLNVPVQRRRYTVRWNRLLADRFFAALSEALEDVYSTIWRGRNGQGS